MKILDDFNNLETIMFSKIPPIEIINFFEGVCHADTILQNNGLSLLSKLSKVKLFLFTDDVQVCVRSKLNLMQLSLCN